jgi:hypothetical protein
MSRDLKNLLSCAKDVVGDYGEFADSYERYKLTGKKDNAFKIKDMDSLQQEFKELKIKIRKELKVNPDKKSEYKFDNLYKKFKCISMKLQEIDVSYDNEAKPTKKKELPNTNNDILTKTQIIQKNATQQLIESTALVSNAIEIGTTGLTTVITDGETIVRVGDNLDTIQSESYIAKKQILRFAKTIYTDKIIILFTFLVIVVIVVLLVLKYEYNKF